MRFRTEADRRECLRGFLNTGMAWERALKMVGLKW